VQKDATDLIWLFVAFDAPLSRSDLRGIAKVGGRGAATCNLYVPYFRTRGY